MTGSLTPEVPLAILQADHSGKISLWRDTWPVWSSGEGGRTHSPASMIHWGSFPSNFPFKIYPGWAESLELILGHESTFSPRLPAFLIKAPFLSTDTCLSNYWLMSSKQPNLSLIIVSTPGKELNKFNCQRLREIEGKQKEQRAREKKGEGV